MRTAAKTVLFSPDDKDGFLLAIGNAAPTLGGFSPEPFAGIQETRSWKPFGVFLGLAVGLLAAGLVGWVTRYSPGPPAYTLTHNTLTIHDRFYPVTLQASAVDVAHIHVVDLAVEPDWRPVARTNGFANGHYRSGWFRAANGSTMRLYQSDGFRLVLLPPNGSGTNVLYQAKEPDEFVQEITEQWAGTSPERP